MRKILFAMLIACTALCSCGTQFGLAYGVKLTGYGDGQFEGTFPQGSYAMDGTAAIDLNVGDTIPFFGQKVTTKSEVIERGDTKQLAAMKAVNDSVAEQFSATEGSGTYDLWLHGFVKETGTALIFEIDRHFTNRPPNVARLKAPADISDPFPFVK